MTETVEQEKEDLTVRLELRISESMMAGLQKRNEKTGAPVSEIVRRAIRKYLKEEN